MAEKIEPSKNSFLINLNLIIAVSAMLVSLASFYATYLQANAADKQVKAMTFPLIQFSSGNYDLETNSSTIGFNLFNRGVGPAIIKKVEFIYLNESYKNIGGFLKACCEKERQVFFDKSDNGQSNIEYQEITSPTSNVILPINGNVNILGVRKFEGNSLFWEKLNQERWNLKVSVCYCSLLDTCYRTDAPGIIEEVKSCK